MPKAPKCMQIARNRTASCNDICAGKKMKIHTKCVLLCAYMSHRYRSGLYSGWVVTVDWCWRGRIVLWDGLKFVFEIEKDTAPIVANLCWQNEKKKWSWQCDSHSGWTPLSGEKFTPPKKALNCFAPNRDVSSSTISVNGPLSTFFLFGGFLFRKVSS